MPSPARDLPLCDLRKRHPLTNSRSDGVKVSRTAEGTSSSVATATDALCRRRSPRWGVSPETMKTLGEALCKIVNCDASKALVFKADIDKITKSSLIGTEINSLSSEVILHRPRVQLRNRRQWSQRLLAQTVSCIIELVTLTRTKLRHFRTRPHRPARRRSYRPESGDADRLATHRRCTRSS